METETYKSAKVILEKFAPEQLRKSGTTSSELTPAKPTVPAITPGPGRSNTSILFVDEHVRNRNNSLI